MTEGLIYLALCWLVFAGAYQQVSWVLSRAYGRNLTLYVTNPNTGLRKIVRIRLKPWMTPNEMADAMNEKMVNAKSS